MTAWRRSDSAFIRASSASCICASNRTKDWSPPALRAVHRQVGVAQQLVGGLLAGVADRDAGGGAQGQLPAVQDERRGQRPPDPLGGPDGALLGVRAGDEDGELVAAEAGHQVARPHRVGEPLGHDAQQLVADVVALRVVDRLEAVQVEEQHADLRAVQRHLQRGLDLRAEQRPVGQPGEPVRVRLLGQLLLEPAALGDVAGVEHQAADVGVVRPARSPSSRCRTRRRTWRQIGKSRVTGRPGLRAAEASAASSRRPSPGRSRAVNRVPTSSLGS